MKIVQITPGSGDNFYCENCLRDEVLVQALRARGHEVVLVPLYLPLQNESPETATDVPIFFGGVNVYLQQKMGLFRKTPRWVDQIFDWPSLLSWASRKAGMTSARDLGETTLSMLQGQEGRQVKELDRLVDWLARAPEKPDVIILSNVLLGGLAAALKQRLGVPVVCLLQDEEGFVDGLEGEYARAAWGLIQGCAPDISAFVAVSRSYEKRIAPRLGLDGTRIHTLYLGIEMAAYMPAQSPPDPPVIGFLSRMCPERGLDTLVEAFILLKRNPELAACRLEIAGGNSQADEPFLQRLKSSLERAGVREEVSFIPEFLGGHRKRWLQGLSVMCVPETEEVAYGLEVMEALASGVPVVQPAIGVFPELIGLTGGGVLVKGNSPRAFADALEPLLLDAAAAHELGKKGRAGMNQHFDIQRTAGELVELLEKIIEEQKA